MVGEHLERALPLLHLLVLNALRHQWLVNLMLVWIGIFIKPVLNALRHQWLVNRHEIDKLWLAKTSCSTPYGINGW